MIWLIFALAFALAGGIVGAVQHSWSVVLVAVAVLLLIVPRLL